MKSPSPLKPVVECIALTKVFQDFWGRDKVLAVDKLDLEIRPGEVFGLLGPNGSGKSTTIKMLLGLLYPTSGAARVFGRPPTDTAIKSRIGFMPEESYLYRFLNAQETLDYYGRLFKLDRHERHRRTEQLIEMVGLKRAARRPVGTYSKGMARRIGLAQALINDPDLLILDEPTTGLDPVGTRQIKDVIKTLGGRGKTVLLCSHLLADVEDVCDRVGIMYGGRRQALGSVGELLQRRDVTQITTSELDEIRFAGFARSWPRQARRRSRWTIRRIGWRRCSFGWWVRPSVNAWRRAGRNLRAGFRRFWPAMSGEKERNRWSSHLSGRARRRRRRSGLPQRSRRRRRRSRGLTCSPSCRRKGCPSHRCRDPPRPNRSNRRSQRKSRTRRCWIG
jgi:ABC-2 type transport system ATP-binding protein